MVGLRTLLELLQSNEELAAGHTSTAPSENSLAGSTKAKHMPRAWGIPQEPPPMSVLKENENLTPTRTLADALLAAAKMTETTPSPPGSERVDKWSHGPLTAPQQ